MAATAKINIKNLDYFKYRKLVVDGNRDDYSVCSKEVKALCDAVQTLAFRDDEFDNGSDRARFDEICSYYRQILSGKRVDPIDMRLKSGWWGDPNRVTTGYSAGKIKQTALMEVLAVKARDWTSRHGGGGHDGGPRLEERLEGPGLYVFKHRERQCFQYVGRADNVFLRCAEKLKAAFDGALSDPLAALLIISMATDWDFYFTPVASTDPDRVVNIIENDLILRHDTIWPHGLNSALHLDSLLEISEFRRSCLRHRWPPVYDTAAPREPQLDLDRLRAQVKAAGTTPHGSTGVLPTAQAGPTARSGGPAAKKTESGTGSTRSNGASAEALDVERPVTPPKKPPATVAPHPRTAAAAKTEPTAATPGGKAASNSSQPNKTTPKPTAAPAQKTENAASTKETSTSKSPTKRKPTTKSSSENVRDMTAQAAIDQCLTSIAPPPDLDSNSDPGSTDQDAAPPPGPLKRSGTFTQLSVSGDTQWTVPDCDSDNKHSPGSVESSGSTTRQGTVTAGTKS